VLTTGTVDISASDFLFCAPYNKRSLNKHVLSALSAERIRQSDPTVTQLVQDMEDKLFTNVLNNDLRVLFHILPDRNNHTYAYNLRHGRHELALAIKGDETWKGNCSKTLTSCFIVAFAVIISRLYVYSFHLYTVAFCQPNFTHYTELN